MRQLLAREAVKEGCPDGSSILQAGALRIFQGLPSLSQTSRKLYVRILDHALAASLALDIAVVHPGWLWSGGRTEFNSVPGID